ncbi:MULTISPECIES: polysaccharide biosynthesis/export family protein [unclassified Oceanicaulis]|uniref:polysaccharide biosynthesis/export family protein n=1 Tax=unclassified Oceanicaulis TaxID=2632123 RepID=UPI0025EC2276|nr:MULTISPECIES: polysaccharide biosynthesis/export family protein [unclassified Oceanicaulis]
MAAPTRRSVLSALGVLALGACASTPQQGAGNSFEPSRFQTWSEGDPAYRLFPGDEVEVTVHTADELNRTLAVGPDGRVSLPLAGSVMVAQMTGPQAARAIADRYARVLLDPIVEVRPVTYGAQQILVGGEVRSPGVYEMISPRMGVMEALTLAGGANNRARLRQVVVLRRAEDGGVMMRTVDIRNAQRGAPTDIIPLARHDIVFAPRTTIAEINDFTELYIRNILPLDNAFAYALADQVFNSN